MIEGKERDYESEGHARTLVEAEEIKADPKKFHKAMKHVKKTHKAHKALMKHAQGALTNGEGGPADEQNESAKGD